VVNREFSEVIDNNLYCYDTFYDPIGQLIGGGLVFILQLTTPSTLKIEAQSAANCAAAAPLSFKGNAVTFER
jgi:hypothetical protein